jgi:hypothetical protein
MMVHLVVTYTTHQVMYYPVPRTEGWKINTADRTIVVGRGVPRILVPLDNVLSIELEECEDRSNE